MLSKICQSVLPIVLLGLQMEKALALPHQSPPAVAERQTDQYSTSVYVRGNPVLLGDISGPTLNGVLVNMMTPACAQSCNDDPATFSTYFATTESGKEQGTLTLSLSANSPDQDTTNAMISVVAAAITAAAQQSDTITYTPNCSPLMMARGEPCTDATLPMWSALDSYEVQIRDLTNGNDNFAWLNVGIAYVEPSTYELTCPQVLGTVSAAVSVIPEAGAVLAGILGIVGASC